MRWVKGALVLLVVGGGLAPRARGGQKAAGIAGALIQPEELARELSAPETKRPVVLQVGFAALYREGHIPGAIYAGPASSPKGLAALREAAARIPRDRIVVIYCGCCPMTRCPNIHPAYAALRRMGFRRLRVLALETDFGRDWTGKGLPRSKEDSPE